MKITLECFTPAEKMPKPSTPMKYFPVWGLVDGIFSIPRRWVKVIWLSDLEQWREVGFNNSVRVLLWCEIPPTDFESKVTP